MFKYGVISGPYFPVFGLNTFPKFSPNTGKYSPGYILRIWALFHAVSHSKGSIHG